MSKKFKFQSKKYIENKKFDEAYQSLKGYFLFPESSRTFHNGYGIIAYDDGEGWNNKEIMRINNFGSIKFNKKNNFLVDEWKYLIIFSIVHLLFGHVLKIEKQKNWLGNIDLSDLLNVLKIKRLWNMSSEYITHRFVKKLKIGKPIYDFEMDGWSKENKAQDIFVKLGKGKLKEYKGELLGDLGNIFSIEETKKYYFFNSSNDGTPTFWKKVFNEKIEEGLLNNFEKIKKKLYECEYDNNLIDSKEKKFKGQLKRIQNNLYLKIPLISSIVSIFKFETNKQILNNYNIEIAAISGEDQILYIRDKNWKDEELEFLLAHEYLHIALQHHSRIMGRDPFIWNCACDYVINGWLKEMNIGIPISGGLFDENLGNISSESLYDNMMKEIKKNKKLSTFSGKGKCDILPSKNGNVYKNGVSLDEFYKSLIIRSYENLNNKQRGLLPLGLKEEIHILSQPIISWDVKLGRWFYEHFKDIESKRTYSRISRRQYGLDISNDIILSKRYFPIIENKSRIFGVILDTSGSMDKKLLGKAIGSIISYSVSRNIKWVRVVYCDGEPYDDGYIDIETLENTIKIIGRGGTTLQKGINYLETRKDFPKEAPILIITDGYCDDLNIKREHAYLLPNNSYLPFKTNGEKFYIK